MGLGYKGFITDLKSLIQSSVHNLWTLNCYLCQISALFCIGMLVLFGVYFNIGDNLNNDKSANNTIKDSSTHCKFIKLDSVKISNTTQSYRNNQ